MGELSLPFAVVKHLRLILITIKLYLTNEEFIKSTDQSGIIDPLQWK